MKSKKFLLLALCLMLVLPLALPLVSCQPAQTQQDGPDCFVFEDEKYPNDILQLDGKILATNTEYNLIAIAKDEPNVSSTTTMRRNIEIFDLATRTVIGTYSSTVYADERETVKVDLSNYPVVKFTEQTPSSQADGPEFEDRYSFYLLTGDKNTFRSLSGNATKSVIRSEKVGNMYLVNVNEDLYWINKDLEVVKTEVMLAADSNFGDGSWENYFNFEAEYCNYLYAWEFRQEGQMIVVYDPNGVCCAMYTFTPGTAMTSGESVVSPKMFVLDDGNVLIQEFVIVEDDKAAYDFMYTNIKLDMVTKIMNYKTGAVTDLPEFNYIVQNLESHYDHEISDEFPFSLAGGYYNQAYLLKVADGKLGTTVDYVVLDNALNVEYTFKNDYLANVGQYDAITNASAEGYYADYYYDGVMYYDVLFNYDGEIVVDLPENTVFYAPNTDYYVTYCGIYKTNGLQVVDFESAGFEGKLEADFIGDSKIAILSQPKGSEDRIRVDIFDAKTGQLSTFIEDSRYTFDTVDTVGDFVVVYDDEKDISSIYNEDLEKVLVVAGTANIKEYEDVITITAVVDGEDVVYVPGYKAVETEDKD